MIAFAVALSLPLLAAAPDSTIVIRVNQVGYLPDAPKVAVVCTLDTPTAYEQLLPDLAPPRAARPGKGDYSPSAVVWHVGVRGLPPAEAAHHNIHFGEQWDESFDIGSDSAFGSANRVHFVQQKLFGDGSGDDTSAFGEMDDQVRTQAAIVPLQRRLLLEVAMPEHPGDFHDAAQLHLAPAPAD